jgi:hypothetical protein
MRWTLPATTRWSLTQINRFRSAFSVGGEDRPGASRFPLVHLPVTTNFQASTASSGSQPPPASIYVARIYQFDDKVNMKY